MKPHISFNLLFTLFMALTSWVHLASAQLKPFGNVIVTTQENIQIDLNDYYVGNNITLSASDSLIVTHKFNSTSTPQSFPLVAQVTTVNVPKDLFGNLDQGQPWYFLDSTFNLTLFTSTNSPTPIITSGSKPIGLNKTYAAIPGYQCIDILRLNKTQNIVVSCLRPINAALYFADYYVIPINPTPTVPSPQYFPFQDGKPRYLAKYPNNDQYVIAYPKSDQACDISAVISIYDVTNLAKWNNTINLRANYFGLSTGTNLCLQSLKVLNETIFVADFSGGVYRADHIFTASGGTVQPLLLSDNILEMIVIDESYNGQIGTTVIVESKTYMYQYDWTDPQNPVLKNKYSLSPIGSKISQILNLEFTQDFISTTVVTQAGDCYILAYYVGQASPDNVYYVNKCPIMPDKVITTRSFNSMFYLTTTPTLMNLYMYQLSREILHFTQQPSAPGFLTSTISIDNSPVETLNVSVIDTTNYSVTATNAEISSNYGITVPGQSTFEINGLLNGPLLTYTSSDPNYNVQPFSTNVVFSGATVKTLSYTNVAMYQPPGATYIYLIQYPNGPNSTTPVASKCTLSSSTNYKCTKTAATLTNQTACYAIAVSGTIVFISNSTTSNAIYAEDFIAAIQPTSLPINAGEKCINILISNSNLATYLYCLGVNSISILQVNNLTIAKNTLVTITSTSFPMIQPESAPQQIQISSTFPSILFFKTVATIYLLNTELMMLGVSPTNALVAKIPVSDPNHGGFNFTLGGNSLLIYMGYDSSLLEYDISHPHVPVLLKTTPLSTEYSIYQFLSNAQSSNNIYIYGIGAQSGEPVALVYQPQMPGNSNYLTAINLPTDLFNAGNPNIVYPQYPVISIDDSTELFLLPYLKQFGWLVSTSVEVLFNSVTPIADSDATDYVETVQVTFTGTHNGRSPSSGIGQVSVELILTDEQVRATESLYYDSSFSMSSDFNSISVDPRNFLNGSISSYTLQPEESSDTVTLVTQTIPGTDIYLNGTSVYWLTMINRTIVAQAGTSLFFVTNGNYTKLAIKPPVSDSSDPDAAVTIVCDHVVYNSELQFLLTTCLNKNTLQYYYLPVQYTSSGPINFNMTSFSDAGKSITNIQKIVFTSELIFILENFGDLGGLIHVFKFSQPSTVTYQTTITGADLNTNTLNIVDFDINFLGTADQYRLYIIDPDFGLRVLDANVSAQVTTFGNPQLYNLSGPANANWNGILTTFQQGDLTLPIGLFITSSNYKNYFIQYSATNGVSILRTFVPIPNANVVNPCYADGQTFVMSAYGTGKQNYALVYSLSNLSSTSTAQNFPLFTVQYTAVTQGVCSLTFDAGATNGPTFYFSKSGNISQYTVHSNISMQFNGKLDSDYITILANSSTIKSDSFKYYLVPPPDGGTNLLFLWIILGVVGLVVIVVLIWYCNTKYKRRRNKIESDSYYGSLPTEDINS